MKGNDSDDRAISGRRKTGPAVEPRRGRRPISLPVPRPGRGKSLHAAFAARGTDRAISGKKLSPQMLSNLLWSACGINRKVGPIAGKGRTAASASNAQEIDVYVATAEGVSLYDPVGNRLLPVVDEDLRALAIGRGQNGMGAQAPVRLIYAVDLERLASAPFQEPGLKDPETQKAYYFVDTGLIAGNVYLFAASRGLAAWFHNCDKEALGRKLGLRKGQRILFAQTVGYKGEGMAPGAVRPAIRPSTGKRSSKRVP